MSKNLTRKGIAFGAVVALGTTLFAGAPALANTSVTVAPSAGTGNTTIIGEAFTIKATAGSLIPSSAFASMKFAVTNSTGAAVTYLVDNGEGNTTTKVDSGSAASNGVYEAGTGTSDVVSDTTGTTGTANTTLSIKTTATAATSVSVIAFLDADGGNDLDAGEIQAASYEVKFVKPADAGLTVEWAPQVGDAKVFGTVKSTVVNVAQIAAGGVKVKWAKYDGGFKQDLLQADSNSDNFSTADSTNSATSAALNADENARVITLGSGATPNGAWLTSGKITAGAYVARAVHLVGSTYTNAGPELSVSLAAAEANATESSYEVVATENVTSAGVVRSGFKGAIVYSVTAKDADKKVLAGKNVRLTTGSLTGTFKVNGVTAAASTAYDALTNASGVATFTVENSNAATNNSFAVGTIVIDGVEESSNAIDLTWTAAAYTVYEQNAAFASSNFQRSGVSNVTLSYVVLDQWKKALTGDAYRIHATLSGSSVAVLTDTLADGSASFSITDGGLDASGKATTVAAKYQELVSGAWQDAASAIADPTDPSNRIINWIAAQTEKITFDGITSTGTDAAVGSGNSELTATIAAEKTAAVNTALANIPEKFAPLGDDTDRVLIGGSVSNNATGAASKGRLVTVSGDSSILFNVGTAWAFGTLSFYASDAGVFSIAAYSNKAQSDSVVTVAANGASKTAKVSFTASTAAAGVVAVTVDAPAKVQPGRSVAFKFTAVDKYGNAVNLASGTSDSDVTITQTGAGYLTSTPLKFVKGVASLVLITQPNDTGSAVIKAVAVLGSSTDITTTATVVVGETEAAGTTAAIAGSTKRFFVSVSGNSTAKNVVVKVAGKTFRTLKGSTAKKTYLVAAPKGSHKVTVFVGGKLIATKTVSVK